MEPVREGEMHPLQNPDILEVIFKGAPLKDLKAFRLVCSLWMLSSSEEMRETAKVKIGGDLMENSLECFTALVGGEHSTWLSAPAASTFTLFRTGAADHSNFFQLCGTHIKRLELEGVEFQSADAMMRAICEDCPNLERLKIKDVTFGSQPQALQELMPLPRPINTGVKTLIADSTVFEKLGKHRVVILSHFPSLQNLLIDGDVLCTDLYPSLARLRDDNRDQLNLKKLAIGFQSWGLGPRPTLILPGLLETGLELEGLSIDCSECLYKDEVIVIQKLLTGHAATLQKLAINLKYSYGDEYYSEEDIISLPNNGTFPKLELWHLSTYDLGFSSLRFLELAPNLHTLSLHFDEYGDHNQLNTPLDRNAGVYPNIIELSVSCGNRKLRHLARKFPNVQKLELLHGNDKTLSLACRLWPKLKSLRLNWALKCTAAGITGYDEEDEERISREGPTGTWRPIFVRKPNLSSLKYLESFILESNSLPNYSVALCGVSELPRLKNLSVGRKNGDYPPDEQLAKFWNSVLARYTNVVPPSLEYGWVKSE